MRRAEASLHDPASVTLLSGGAIIPVAPKGLVIHDGAVAIAAGRIVALGPRALVEADYPGAVRIDCTGRVILPGFVNTHVHAGMSLMRSMAGDLPLLERLRRIVWPFMDALDEAAARAAMRLGCMEMALAGYTAFADMFPMIGPGGEEVRRFGLRALLAPYVRDEADGFAEIAAAGTEWRGDALIRPAIGLQSLYAASEAVLERAAGLATESGLPVHVHIAEHRAEVEDGMGVARLDALGLLRAGGILAHCVHVNEAELARIAETGAGISHNPGSNAKLGTGNADLARIQAHGIAVGLGTDSVAANDRHDPFAGMRMAALLPRRYGMPRVLTGPADVLELATLGGARLLGIAAQTGSLEIGKWADLCVLRLDDPRHEPLDWENGAQLLAAVVFCGAPEDVDMVMVGGHAIVRDGALAGQDGAEILATASMQSARVLSRAGLV